MGCRETGHTREDCDPEGGPGGYPLARRPRASVREAHWPPLTRPRPGQVAIPPRLPCQWGTVERRVSTHRDALRGVNLQSTQAQHIVAQIG